MPRGEKSGWNVWQWLMDERRAAGRAAAAFVTPGLAALTALSTYGINDPLVITLATGAAMSVGGATYFGLSNLRLRSRLARKDLVSLPQAHGRPWEDQFVHVSRTLRIRDAAYVDMIAARLASAPPGSEDALRAAQLMDSARGAAEHLATCASNIFQAHIQHPCTVTVLILREEAYVDIFARNDTARARNSERRYTLGDNAATEHIISTGDPYYLCNDCAASSEFFYKSRNWRDRFNHLCVIGIPNPEYERTRTNRFLGFLAIDSLHGRFESMSPERWAQQFANHLSICLYAWNKLESAGRPLS